MRADMHVHTLFSDGLITPEEAAKGGAENGVKLLAVTDHDTALGVPAARAECERLGLVCVTGIEVSAYLGGVKLHTLGYNFDSERPEFVAFSRRLYEGSMERCEDILKKLKGCGVYLSFEDIEGVKAEYAPAHVMHAALAAAKKGYCGGDRFAFYRRYLAPSQPAYSDIMRPAPEEAIEVINACGGFTSLAHPGRIELDGAELYLLIKRLAGAGLGGIECVYSTHTDVETEYYRGVAAELSLVCTGGSDTHYIGGRRKIGTPEFHVGGRLAALLGIESQA